MATKGSIREQALQGALLPRHKKAGLYLIEEGEILILKDGKVEVDRWAARSSSYIALWNSADAYITKTYGVPA